MLFRSGSLSESVIRLISTFQQVEECQLSHANCISQPVDMLLLIPAISAYSAARSVPVSRLRSTCQPLDQHLISHTMIIYSATRSSPQPLDLCLLSPMTSAYSAMRSVPDSHLINDYQPLDHRLISFTISTSLSMGFSR